MTAADDSYVLFYFDGIPLHNSHKKSEVKLLRFLLDILKLFRKKSEKDDIFIFYFATDTLRVSRITVTLICPG